MCIDSLNLALWVRFFGRYWYQSFIDGSNIWGVVFHGLYWYQSFIDGSNIWGVDRTDPWGPDLVHPLLGRSYFVVVPLYDMSCVLILLTRPYGWDSTADIDINPSSTGPILGVWIGPTLGVPKWTLWVRFHGRYWYQSFINRSNIWGVVRTDPLGPEMDHPPLGRSFLVVVLSFDMSCASILLTGFHGWDSIVDIDINPSLMDPIFGVWIGPTLGVPKWTIRQWAAAIW